MTTHFIRDQFADKESKKVDRIREWLFAKMNKNNFSKNYWNPFQIGCPEIIPKLTARPFWY